MGSGQSIWETWKKRGPVQTTVWPLTRKCFQAVTTLVRLSNTRYAAARVIGLHNDSSPFPPCLGRDQEQEIAQLKARLSRLEELEG